MGAGRGFDVRSSKSRLCPSSKTCNAVHENAKMVLADSRTIEYGDMIRGMVVQGYEVIFYKLVKDHIVMPLRSCGRAQSEGTSPVQISDSACAMIIGSYTPVIFPRHVRDCIL